MEKGLIRTKSLAQRNKEIVAKEIERIKNQSSLGILKAEDVVEAASFRDSALHPYFEWDDSEAARKYRIQQAQWLILQTKVTFIDSQKVPGYMRVTVVISDKKKIKGYFTTEEVLNDEEMTLHMLKKLVKEVEHLCNKFRGLKELPLVINKKELFILEQKIQDALNQ